MKNTITELGKRVNEIEDLFVRLDRLDDIEDEVEREEELMDIGDIEYDDLVSEIYKIEEEIRDYIESPEEKIASDVRKIKEQIDFIKKSNDFPDEDGELDMMFPNGVDEDLMF